jgi:regulator of protease activity HflC (stomatin/prohibitin superfamily)
MLFLLFTFFAFANSYYVTIPTGNVGVVYTWNEIQNTTLKPGLNFYNPLISKVALVDILPQTDIVKDVECGTNDGLKLYFTYVEVGNRLPIHKT